MGFFFPVSKDLHYDFIVSIGPLYSKYASVDKALFVRSLADSRDGAYCVPLME